MNRYMKQNVNTSVPRKVAQVTRRLRHDIVSRRLRPGARLPTRREMLRQFRVSPVTVQRAVDELIKDGFAVARGPLGTFVADRPPHLSTIALVIPSPRPRSLFHEAIAEAARQVQSDASAAGATFRFAEYHYSHYADDRGDWDRLCADAAAHRFGGIIYTMPPFDVGRMRRSVESGVAEVTI